ncbi:hypothetical protein TSUD_274310 [Trifolium subterraneum]|uniref:Phytochrome chromophore attachment site domain-containing protein n=1 Tax=Trifolium subterraneum TaxID=3900 RepID=A0A2Z6NKS4_TRISU|nr:hypothetical protein TSUD_274310 [Trifolium subterraneum]
MPQHCSLLLLGLPLYIMATREISRLKLIRVHARTTEKPFYAMLHRIDVGVVIDLEPVSSSGLALSLSVQKLTRYDRVMIYNFHEDDHGEVVSEIRRSDLEPYLGFHYLAIDIPQAARFLFKQNRVRLISYCHVNPVKLGITPTKLQVKDIVEWLLGNYGDSTGLATESLADASYPGATFLGDAICGMASARISPRHILFRSSTAKEIRWR